MRFMKNKYILILALSFINLSAYAHAETHSHGNFRFQCFEVNLGRVAPIRTLSIQANGDELMNVSSDSDQLQYTECGLNEHSDDLKNSSIQLIEGTSQTSTLEINIENKCSLSLPSLDRISETRNGRVNTTMSGCGMMGCPVPIGGVLTTPNGKVKVVCAFTGIATGGRASGGN